MVTDIDAINIESIDYTVTLYAVIIFYALIGSKLNQQLYSYVSTYDTFILPIRYLQ